MKQQQFVYTCAPGHRIFDTVAELRELKLLLKHIVTIEAKGMRIAESIAGEFVSPIDQDRIGHPRTLARLVTGAGVACPRR